MTGYEGCKVILWIYEHQTGWSLDPAFEFSLTEMDDIFETFGSEVYFFRLYPKKGWMGIFFHICLNEIEFHVLCPDLPSFLHVFPIIEDLLGRFLENDQGL